MRRWMGFVGAALLFSTIAPPARTWADRADVRRAVELRAWARWPKRSPL
jgi:hypothetical protein